MTSSVIYYSTHVTQENVIEGLSNGLLKGFWGMKKEKQVRSRGFDTICVCVL